MSVSLCLSPFDNWHRLQPPPRDPKRDKRKRMDGRSAFLFYWLKFTFTKQICQIMLFLNYVIFNWVETVLWISKICREKCLLLGITWRRPSASLYNCFLFISFCIIYLFAYAFSSLSRFTFILKLSTSGALVISD